MLSKILTKKNCAICRNCCVFHEHSRWETPVVDEKTANRIKEKLHNEKSVISYKDSFVLASVQRDLQLEEGQEIYKCAALDESSGCTLSDDEKPFDCKLWPLRIMEKDNRIFIMIAKGCNSVDDTFIENVNTLIAEGLKERILIEMSKNPDIVKNYSNEYIPVCDITEDVTRILLKQKDSDACEDCYLGLYVWKERYGLELLKMGDGYVFKSSKDNSYLFPMPQKNAVSVINLLQESSNKIEFHRITQSQKEFMEEKFPGKFTFEEDTGSFDYLYEVEKLAYLKGKKLAKKRNHINSFLAEFDNWSVEVISDENVKACRKFALEWYENRMELLNKDDSVDGKVGLDSLVYEREALLRVLDNYNELDADGILIKISDDIVSFAIGQRISERTYDVVFEKASEKIRGSYNIINREFVRFLKDKYPNLKYINRENDLDLPGLRKAKRSYMPCAMVIKYNAFSV